MFAELHRRGLTWDQIARSSGASSGDYVRKVAAGVKPGNNLLTNARELAQTGRVAAAAPRRVGAGGELARVRAPAASGAPSRVPTPASFVPGARTIFQAARDGRAGWQQQTSAPARGIGRESARQEVLDALRSAARGGRRVEFLVTGADGVPHRLGGKGGYDAGRALRGARREGDDPFSWLEGQFDGRYGITASGIRAVMVSAQ